MKIGVECRGIESDVANNYADIFEQYNADVKRLLGTCIQMINTAKKKLDISNLTVDSLKKDIVKIDASIEECEKSIKSSGYDKDSEIEKLINEIKQQRIDLACVYTKEQVDDVESKYIKAKEDSQSGKPEHPTYDEMIDNVNLSLRSDIEMRDTLAGIMDDLGKNFDLSFTEGDDWCNKFKDLYVSKSADVESMDEYQLMEIGKVDKTKNQILDEYSRKYSRISIRDIYKYLLWLFFLPIGIINRRNGLQPPNPIGYTGSIVGSVVSKDTRIITIASLAALFAEYGVFIYNKYIGVIALSLFIFMVTGLIFQKRNVVKYSNSIITSYLYYNYITSEVEERVQKKFDEFVQKYRLDRLGDSEQYKNELDMMLLENKKCKDKVANEFNPDDVDKSKLIEMYNKKIADLNNSIESSMVRKSSLEDKLNKAIEKQKDVLHEYNATVDSIKNIFRNGTEVPNLNSHGKDKCHNFIYIIAYSNIYSIINGFHVKNAFGYGVNGVNPSNPALTRDDISGGLGDLAPRTIPICFEKIDISKLVSLVKADVSVSDILQEIIDSVADEYSSKIKSTCDYTNDNDLDKYDIHNLYEISLAKHDYKCSLFLYNSEEDNNYVLTISRLIYERFFKATYLTAHPKAFRHHFMVKDTNYFNDGNISTLSKSAGTSNDVIVDMIKTNVYDIVGKDKYSELLKNVLKQGNEFRDKVAELNATNMLEYIIKCKAKGSAPYMCDYLYLWHDVDTIKCDALIDILHETGGSKSAGDKVSSENKVGIIPFIFLDVAKLKQDKPDKTYLTNLKTIVEAIAYDKFFSVGVGARTLKKMSRDTLLSDIDKAIERSNKH